MKKSSELEKISRIIEDISPARKEELNRAFFGDRDDEPAMQQMNYGGNYTFYHEGRMVELDGDFSKADLIKIASSMSD